MSHSATSSEMPTLSQSQLEIATLLADGMSQSEAAHATGVSRRTIQRWQKLEAFQREILNRRAQRQADERVKEAKVAADRGFNLEEAIAQLRKAKAADREVARAAGNELLAKCSDRIQQLSPEDIAVRDLPALLRSSMELLKWSIESEAEELELDQLIELKLGPESLLAQKVEIEADAAVERMFQEIALTNEIPAEMKQVFYRLIGGLDGGD